MSESPALTDSPDVDGELAHETEITPVTPPNFSGRQNERTPPSGRSSISSGTASRRSSWRVPDSADALAEVTHSTPPLGLAGPKSKNHEISPEKQTWVDGMLAQVRKASEQKREEREDFGNLGRTGNKGVKRVFVKDRSSFGPPS
jgi:hypothetical protein